MPWCTIPLGQREDQRSVREWGREAVCFRTPEPHGLPGEEVVWSSSAPQEPLEPIGAQVANLHKKRP
jgi:hypothetical protein